MENNRTDPVGFYYFVTFLTRFVVVPFLLSSVSVCTLANSAPCCRHPGGGHLV